MSVQWGGGGAHMVKAMGCVYVKWHAYGVRPPSQCLDLAGARVQPARKFTVCGGRALRARQGGSGGRAPRARHIDHCVGGRALCARQLTDG